MVILCIRYRCSVSDDFGESWKAFRVPFGMFLSSDTERRDQHFTDESVLIEALIASGNDKEKVPKAAANVDVPLLELLKQDDFFTKFFPVSKLFCRGNVVDERSSTALAVAEQKAQIIKKYTSGDEGASFAANRKMITAGPVKSNASGDPFQKGLTGDGKSGGDMILEVSSCRLWDVIRFRNRMLSNHQCIVIDLFAHRENGNANSFTTTMRLPYFMPNRELCTSRMSSSNINSAAGGGIADEFCITSQGENHNIRILDLKIDAFVTLASSNFNDAVIDDYENDGDDEDNTQYAGEDGKEVTDGEDCCENGGTKHDINVNVDSLNGNSQNKTREPKKQNDANKINKEDNGDSPIPTFSCIMLESTPGIHTTGVSKDTLKHYRYAEHVDTDAALDKHHVTGVQWREVPANHAWSSQYFPGGVTTTTGESILRKDKGWKNRIRSGIPHIHRWFVLPSIVMGPKALGSQENITKVQNEYKAIQDHIFAGVPNELFIPRFPSHFGSMFIDEFKKVIPLISPTGWRHYNISLVCLSNRNPDVVVSPIIPAVLAVVYLILTPCESYTTVCTLIEKSRVNAANNTIMYFPLCRQSNNAFVEACTDVVKKKCSSSANMFKGDVMRETIRRIIFSFFIFTLPHVFVLQILDSFSNEGFKIIPRYILGVFSVFSPQIRASNDPFTFLTGGPKVTNSSYNICTHASFDRIVKVAFGASLSKASFMLDVKPPTANSTIRESDIYMMDTGFETKECARIWPHVEVQPGYDNSDNKSKDCIAIKSLSTGGSDLYRREMLFCWLSSYSRLILLYRASEHGSNLGKLYQACCLHESSSALIVVRLASGASVGVFTSHMPAKISKVFCGSLSDYMFYFPALEDQHTSSTADVYQGHNCGPTRYCVTGINNNYVLCGRDYLIFGQGPALKLSADLQTAESSKCSTFGTDSLFPGMDGEAHILEVEVFAVVY
eukprot:Tbor_TRINITY_DN4196_c0_g1::TRINITY_DN4196_c0_g1_i1::g.26601::m.26601